jgi:hypothetical protein
VALLIFAVWPASAVGSGWRLVAGLGAVPALVGLALRTQMPESSRWLLRHGKYEQFSSVMVTLGVGRVSVEQGRQCRGCASWRGSGPTAR